MIENVEYSTEPEAVQPEVAGQPDMDIDEPEILAASVSVHTEPIPILPSASVGLPITEFED